MWGDKFKKLFCRNNLVQGHGGQGPVRGYPLVGQPDRWRSLWTQEETCVGRNIIFSSSTFSGHKGLSTKMSSKFRHKLVLMTACPVVAKC